MFLPTKFKVLPIALACAMLVAATPYAPTLASEDDPLDSEQVVETLAPSATPDGTAAPDETAAPDGTVAPDETVAPDGTAAPEATLSPEDLPRITEEPIPMPISAPISTFVDVKEDDWFAGEVAEAVQLNLFSGTSETEFSPEDSMTRAMFVTVLYRLDGSPTFAEGVETESFVDVESGAYYEAASVWAKTLGILTGDEDGNFCPEDAITRQDIAVLLDRFDSLGSSDSVSTASLAFEDSDQISDYALDSFVWANEVGLINGSDNLCEPLATATRAQVATIVVRYTKLASDN